MSLDLSGLKENIVGKFPYELWCGKWPEKLDGPLAASMKIKYEYPIHLEILTWWDHDFMGCHLLVQAWDYAKQDNPDQEWKFYLIYIDSNGEPFIVADFPHHKWKLAQIPYMEAAQIVANWHSAASQTWDEQILEMQKESFNGNSN